MYWHFICIKTEQEDFRCRLFSFDMLFLIMTIIYPCKKTLCFNLGSEISCFIHRFYNYNVNHTILLLYCAFEQELVLIFMFVAACMGPVVDGESNLCKRV